MRRCRSLLRRRAMTLSYQRRIMNLLTPEKMSFKHGKRLFDRLNFFRTSFNFSPPFHVLVDDTFVCSAIANGKLNIKDHLEKVLNGKCKLLMTSCVLDTLHESFPGNAVINKLIDEEITMFKCMHSCKLRNPAECLTLLAKGNRFKKSLGAPRKKRHVLIEGEDPRYIVATQQEELLKTFRQIPGVPVVFFKSGSVSLDAISKSNTEWAGVLRLKKMENMAIRLEILYHAIAEETDTDNRSATAEEKTGENKAMKAGEEGEPKSIDELGNKRLNKRKRDISPDICDIPIPCIIFNKFRKLQRTTSKTKDGRTKDSNCDQEKLLGRENSMQLTTTCVSSSEQM